MSKQKMLAARELIQEKRYAEARSLLKTMDDPKAKEWLRKLDEIAPEKKSGGKPVVVAAAVVVVAVIIIAVTLITRQNNSTPASQNAVVQVPTQMELPSVTATATSETMINSEAIELVKPTQVTTIDSSEASTNNDDFERRLQENLAYYCFVPIDLMQALDLYEQRERNQLLFSDLVSEDVHQLCSEWAEHILGTRYNAAAYCLQQADDEFREATFYECLDARNFHFGDILGEGWESTASEIIDLDQSWKASMGIPTYADLRTWGEEDHQVSEIRIGSTVIVNADDGLNIRSGAGMDRSILFNAADGSIFVVEDGPIQANGLTWWQVRDPQNSRRSGWTAADYLDVQATQ